jgi:hypothetical protein
MVRREVFGPREEAQNTGDLDAIGRYQPGTERFGLGRSDRMSSLRRRSAARDGVNWPRSHLLMVLQLSPNSLASRS